MDVLQNRAAHRRAFSYSRATLFGHNDGNGILTNTVPSAGVPNVSTNIEKPENTNER